MKSERLKKIKKHVVVMEREYTNDLKFSKELAHKRIQLRLTNYSNRFLHTHIETSRLIEEKDSIIFKYLFKYSILPTKKYINKVDLSTKSMNAPIFVCWWDGIDRSPVVVKKCIESIKAHASDHPVYIIDKKNVREFLNIPDYILNKVKKKHMNLAVLADYIRVSLLSKYGGLWIDATVFVTSDIPEEYFNKRFYSVNGESAFGYIANGRWATYVIGGWKNSLLFKFVRDSFEFYWKDNEYAIDYFLIDYFIELAYRNLETARMDIDSLELNNPHRFRLRDAMLRGDYQELYEQNIYEDTCFNKLSWKSNYKLKTKSGEPSVYEYWLSL